ncbi:hypothetical protein ACSBL2_13650 [Pedobacter sp. AW31-3R]|uniref:hypothetical protein n=1 Tax=Pedobacter sp. AW31-3R TaxID=3445781 RepID=UPI003FA0B856
MKTILTFIFIALISFAGFSQSIPQNHLPIQKQDKIYAYILVQGKLLSKKLKVKVDFGDTEEQLKAGEEYSQILTNKKSYAAILNYMVENGFELIQTLDYTDVYSGSGGTSGVVFIMKKM